jgi:hypothetical protein
MRLRIHRCLLEDHLYRARGPPVIFEVSRQFVGERVWNVTEAAARAGLSTDAKARGTSAASVLV